MGNKKVEKVFQFLKEKEGLIKKDRNLYPTEKIDYFKASHIFNKIFIHPLGKNEIYYNPKLSLKEDEIAVSLLHEEGHMTQQQNFINFLKLMMMSAFIVILPAIIKIILSVFLNLTISLYVDIIFWLLWIVLVSLFSLLSFTMVKAYSDRFKSDEYDADFFAGKKIRDITKYQNEPSKILESALESLEEQKDGDSSQFKKFLLAGVIHPPKAERVKKLRKNLKDVGKR